MNFKNGRTPLALLCIVLLVAISPRTATAEDEVKEIFPSFPPHGKDPKFIPLEQSIGKGLTAYPVAASGTAFVFELFEIPGIIRRWELAEEGFGTTFTDRAVTSGQGRLTVALSTAQMEWKKFDGHRLDDAFNFDDRQYDVNGNVIGGSITKTELEMTTQVVTGTFIYGLLETLDLSVSIPWVKHEWEGRWDTYVFGGGGQYLPFAWEDTTEGLGDIIGRAKWKFLDSEGKKTDLALAFDFKSESGDHNLLLGSPYPKYTPWLIASKKTENFTYHLNFGYSFTESGFHDYETFEYRLGIERIWKDDWTVAFEVIGSHDDFDHIIDSALTWKWRPFEQEDILLKFAIQKPLGTEGLRPDYAFFLGIEFSFGLFTPGASPAEED